MLCVLHVCCGAEKKDIDVLHVCFKCWLLLP